MRPITWDPSDVESQRQYVVVHLLEAAGEEIRAASWHGRSGQYLTAAKADTVGNALLEAAWQLSTLELDTDHVDVDAPCSDLVAWLISVVGRYRRQADEDRRGNLWHAAEQWERVAAVLERLPGPFLGLGVGSVFAD